MDTQQKFDMAMDLIVRAKKIALRIPPLIVQSPASREDDANLTALTRRIGRMALDGAGFNREWLENGPVPLATLPENVQEMVIGKKIISSQLGSRATFSSPHVEHWLRDDMAFLAPFNTHSAEILDGRYNVTDLSTDASRAKQIVAKHLSESHKLEELSQPATRGKLNPREMVSLRRDDAIVTLDMAALAARNEVLLDPARLNLSTRQNLVTTSPAMQEHLLAKAWMPGFLEECKNIDGFDVKEAAATWRTKCREGQLAPLPTGFRPVVPDLEAGNGWAHD